MWLKPQGVTTKECNQGHKKNSKRTWLMPKGKQKNMTMAMKSSSKRTQQIPIGEKCDQCHKEQQERENNNIPHNDDHHCCDHDCHHHNHHHHKILQPHKHNQK